MICPCSPLSSETPLVNGFCHLLKPLPPLKLKPMKRILCEHREDPKTNLTMNPIPMPAVRHDQKSKRWYFEETNKTCSQVGAAEMMGMCGFGYWMQGFRCFPWLALNYHMAHNLALHPSVLQLVQNSGNLPMVAKPLYGILSDAFYINGAHRLPYISIGVQFLQSMLGSARRSSFSSNDRNSTVLLQVLSWGPLALIPFARESLPNLMACVLLGNLGASITEVAMDALVAEYGKKHRMVGIQPYAFVASAVGGILGNLLGGCCLPRASSSRTMFLIFSALLSLHFVVSVAMKEESFGLKPNHSQRKKPILKTIQDQRLDLQKAIHEENILNPLIWIVSSIAMVPILSGSIFCYQTQILNLDPGVIGMSRVIGQLLVLSSSILFNRFWKDIPMRKLISTVQILYALSLLLDLVLVKQINLRLGIPNDIFVLCFSSLAETVAQFKLLPFMVLLANLCPRGCEGSLTSFVASALCVASIVSGFMGVGLASVIGITVGDFSSLPLGIVVQFIAALVPLRWMDRVPELPSVVEKESKRGGSKRSRKNRRVGRVVFGSVYGYRRERESEPLR